MSGAPKSRTTALAALLLAALAVAVLVAARHADHGPSRSNPTGDAAVAQLSPAAQAALLEPLRRLAGALDDQGRGADHDGYSGVELEAATGTVDLFTTDLAAGHAVQAAARRADPGAAWSRVRLEHASYTRARLDAAAQRVVSRPPPDLHAVAVPPDGSALDVDVVHAGAATSLLQTDLGVDVRLHVDSPDVAKSWTDVKWHDNRPFIGGDVLTAAGSGYCTAGLPAVRRSDGHPVLITAAHCFRTGQRVYTAAGTTGAFGNGRTGSYVGTVGTRSTIWDAEPLVGADNNADESDTSGWKPLTSVAYSYVGDYVCQNGAASYYLHHPTPCGIKVTDSDIWFPIAGYWARGVEGIDVSHEWGSHNGDSGGTVFAVQPGNARQARGIVSSGGSDGTSDQKRVDWTEAVDIFAAYHLALNPRR